MRKIVSEISRSLCKSVVAIIRSDPRNHNRTDVTDQVSQSVLQWSIRLTTRLGGNKCRWYPSRAWIVLRSCCSIYRAGLSLAPK